LARVSLACSEPDTSTRLELFAIRASVTACIAIASYFFVEMPVRRAQPRDQRARVWAAVVAPVAAATAAVVLFVATAGGAPAPAFDVATVPRAAVQRAPRDNRTLTSVLVAGDSVAFSLGYTDQAAVRTLGFDMRATGIVGCGIAGGRADRRQEFGGITCDTWPQEYAAAVDAQRPRLSMLVVGAWETLDHHTPDGRVLRVGSPEYRLLLYDRLDKARVILTRHRARMVIALAPYFAVQYDSDTAYGRYQDDRTRIVWVDGVLQSYAAERRIPTVDFCALLCPTGSLRSKIDGIEMRPDGMHFSPVSAVVAWRWLAPQLRRVMRNGQR
jgi:hypothetical protein